MKIFTYLKGALTLFVLFSLISVKLVAQTAAITPANSTITANGSQTFTTTTTGLGGNNDNRTFVYTVSGPGATIPASPATFNCSSGCNTKSHTFQFPTAGVYTVSVTVTQTQNGSAVATTSTTLTVTPPPPPAVTLAPTPTASEVVGGSLNFTSSTSNFTGSGTITYTWSVSPGTDGEEFVIPAGNSSSKNIIFNAAGEYTVSVVASMGSEVAASPITTATVFQPNLYSTSGTGTIKAYKINPIIGSVTNGPVDLISPSSSTAGLGKNKANANDPNGNLYYILNTSNNNGVVEVYSMSPIGAGNTSVGTIDLNGAGNTSSLGFVRVGFDANGKGWIIAGDGRANVYIASFQGNGTNAITNINTYGNTSLAFSGSGSAADFQNGDLAIGPNGVLYALANVTGADTYIYTLNSLANPTTLTRKWTVQTGGASFAGTSVNGVAWTQTGSLHISTGNGLYFIDQTTANSATGTVQSFLISSVSGLTDLASSEFPSNSTLPVSFGEISVKKSGANAELNWVTLNEINNDYFLVERSEDGINFKSAGKVFGKGGSSSQQFYNYLDPINSSAKVIYYRLKQFDLDGKTFFSNTVSLRLSGIKLNNYTVYPNPFASDIKLQIETEKQAAMTVRISTVSGQVVINKQVSLQKGQNIVVVPNLESLKPGMYIVEMISADWKQTLRVTKQ